ncbi:uncharacterized protein LOC143893034 [Tasmannia lanceolata]|uniref:uncharacterized protein LOC143893034 n=1 Tax=Tasmannia lanceolata TaxID=3420 RepID=UPI004064B20C
MGERGLGGPSIAPSVLGEREEERWRHFDNSVNAVSFGFVATAILISMFLVMAIFERFLRHTSHPRPQHAPDHLPHPVLSPKPSNNASPKMSIYAKGVSVLMPGQDIPTFIAHPAPPPAPAPAPCPPERISWPLHHNSFTHTTSNTHHLPI